MSGEDGAKAGQTQKVWAEVRGEGRIIKVKEWRRNTECGGWGKTLAHFQNISGKTAQPPLTPHITHKQRPVGICTSALVCRLLPHCFLGDTCDK